MNKFNVKMSLDDNLNRIHVDVYQLVTADGKLTEEEILQRAKQQFRAWAMTRGSDWQMIAHRVPFAEVSAVEVQAAN